MSGEAAYGAVGRTEAEAPFVRMRTAVILVLVGVFAFSALVVLLAWAPALENGDNGGAHALSRSAVGYAGLVEALRLDGVATLISRSRLPAGRGLGLLIATPQFQADEKAARDLGFKGPVLIVLPKWMTFPDPLHHGWVTKLGLLDPRLVLGEKLAANLTLVRRREVAAPILRIVGPARGAPLLEGPVDRLQSMKGAGWTPVLQTDGGEVVLAKDSNAEIFLLSDPDLLNNHGLQTLATMTGALGLVRALRAGDGPVIFDVTLNGLVRERSLLRLFFAPPFIAVTLCLAAAAALAGFQAFCRFGPVRREERAIAPGKAVMVDNAALLIRAAGRQGPMAGRYARLSTDLVARALGAPRTLTGEQRTVFLDRLGEWRGARDSLSVLSALAGSADGEAAVSRIGARLSRWRREMTQ
ncbi:MAG: hypothetical protein ACYC8V_05955 [Caulobacteraceae bacterium]